MGRDAQRVLEAIRAIGPESFFVASDSGLTGTPNHTDCARHGGESAAAKWFR